MVTLFRKSLTYIFRTVACPDVSYPNGMIVYNPSTSPRLEGTTATHTCNTGYRPHSGETIFVRTCQSNGHWDISDRVCVGTLLLREDYHFVYRYTCICICVHALQNTLSEKHRPIYVYNSVKDPRLSCR